MAVLVFRPSSVGHAALLLVPGLPPRATPSWRGFGELELDRASWSRVHFLNSA